MVNRNIAYNQNSCSNSDLASSIRDIPCTLQNCDLNTNNCSLIRSSSSLSSNGGGIIGGASAIGGCYSAPSTMKMNQHQQTSNQSLAQILATNQSTQNLYEQYFDCMNTGGVSQTILPPPLFDNSCTANYGQCYEMQNHAGNYCTLSAIEMPKMTSSSSKRLHRTIPKHFTMSSASSSAILGGNEMPQTHQQQQQHQHQPSTSVSRNGSTSSSSDNKKPTCQCPVQHVPMTYMTSQFSGQPTQQQQSQSQEIQMQQLQPTQNYSQSHQRHQHSSMYAPSSGSNSKKNNVIKSTTFPSAMNASSANGKIQTIANAELMMGTEIITQGMHQEMSSNNSGGGTLRRSHKTSSSSSAHSNNSNGMPVTPNKKSIATISVATPQALASGPYFTTKVDSKQHQPQQIHSILKNKNHSGCHVNVINVTDPSVGGGSGGTVSEPNPILPPKMYKNSNKYSTTSNGSGGGGSKQIHTITRPNELTTSSSQFSLLAINSPGGNSQKYQHQQLQLQQQQQQQQSSQFQHPQQLRTNIQVGLQCYPMEYHSNFNKISLQGTLYNTKSLPRGGFVCEDGSKNRLSFSGSSSSHHQPPQLQHQQLQQQSVTQSYSTNTLPKNHHQQQPASQQIYGKVANPSRSMITDVVNKVPSVIMLPIPQQQPQQGAQMILKTMTLTPSNSLLKMSTSKNNISNDSVDGSVVETGSSSGCHSHNSTLKRSKQKRDAINVNEKVISSKGSVSSASSSTQISSSSGVGTASSSEKHSGCGKFTDKPLPILTTSTNCTNPKEHFLPNDTSLDDDYLSECENCKTAGSGSRYYLDDEELDELPLQETMTLQRKLINQSGMDPMNDENDSQNYYRVSSTLPTNTNKKTP